MDLINLFITHLLFSINVCLTNSPNDQPQQIQQNKLNLYYYTLIHLFHKEHQMNLPNNSQKLSQKQQQQHHQDTKTKNTRNQTNYHNTQTQEIPLQKTQQSHKIETIITPQQVSQYCLNVISNVIKELSYIQPYIANLHQIQGFQDNLKVAYQQLVKIKANIANNQSKENASKIQQSSKLEHCNSIEGKKQYDVSHLEQRISELQSIVLLRNQQIQLLNSSIVPDKIQRESSYHQKTSQLIKVNQNQNDAIVQLTTEINNLKESVQKLGNQKTKLQSLLVISSEQVSKLKECVAYLNQTMLKPNSLEDQLMSYKSRLQLELLQQQMGELKIANERLDQELQMKNKVEYQSSDQLKQELSMLQNQNTKKQEEIADYIENKNSLQKQIKEYQRLISESTILSKSLKVLRQSISEFKDETPQLFNNYTKSMSQNFENIMGKIQKNQERLNTSTQSIKRLNQKIKSRWQNYRLRVKDMQGVISKLQNQVKGCELKLNQKHESMVISQKDTQSMQTKKSIKTALKQGC